MMAMKTARDLATTATAAATTMSMMATTAATTMLGGGGGGIGHCNLIPLGACWIAGAVLAQQRDDHALEMDV